MWNYLRPAEISRLDAYLTNKIRDKVLFKLMYRCGLRVGEVVGEEYFYEVGDRKKPIEAHSILPGIKTNDIDFESKGVLVHGKGDLDRNVPIPDDVVAEILHYLHQYRRWNGYDNVQLITKYKDDEPMGTANVRKIWRKVKKHLKLRKEVRVHDLRHTFAMEYLRNEGDIRDLMRLLGHSKVDITMMYVDRLESETNVDARRVMQKMGPRSDVETGDLARKTMDKMSSHSEK
jgi:site-specific recombinase XerD